jgi:hypothetical protein
VAEDGGPLAVLVTADASDVVRDASTAPRDAALRADAATTDATAITPTFDAETDDAEAAATGDDAATGDGEGHDGGWTDSCGHKRPDAFADEVIAFTPGPTAGYGQSELPCVVLGPPVGGGLTSGSLDVLSLGNEGSIVLKFDDVELVDGPGPDLIVFENALPGFVEPGFVAVSQDGQDWHEWPCQPEDADAGYPYCAGIRPVLSSPSNGISPTDPAAAGGDDFDLAALGISRARYVRIRDSGFSHYGATTGGFDLDAIAAANAQPAGD